MGFEEFNFTRRTHCPHCKTKMILIEKKVISCPLCEIMKRERAVESEKEYNITQEIF